MIDKPTLKPCPFCGGDDLSLTHDSKDTVCWVHCNGCYSTGRAGHTEDQTSSYWNTRPQPTEAQIEAAARALKELADKKMSEFLEHEVEGFDVSLYYDEAKIALTAASETVE